MKVLYKFMSNKADLGSKISRKCFCFFGLELSIAWFSNNELMRWNYQPTNSESTIFFNEYLSWFIFQLQETEKKIGKKLGKTKFVWSHGLIRRKWILVCIKLYSWWKSYSSEVHGSFQLEFVSISQVINHMTC